MPSSDTDINCITAMYARALIISTAACESTPLSFYLHVSKYIGCILQGLMSRIKETTVMLGLLGILANCVAWLLSSMLGSSTLSQENILRRFYGLLAMLYPIVTEILHLAELMYVYIHLIGGQSVAKYD